MAIERHLYIVSFELRLGFLYVKCSFTLKMNLATILDMAFHSDDYKLCRYYPKNVLNQPLEFFVQRSQNPKLPGACTVGTSSGLRFNVSFQSESLNLVDKKFSVLS